MTQRNTFILLAHFVLLFSISSLAEAKVTSHKGGYKIMREFMFPGSPEEIFDAMTGEVKEWWDHSHSANPVSITIEPKSGGKFYEIFDDQGNGAVHADIIYSDRGKMLKWDGPMGFSGDAIHMVTTFEFMKQDDSTIIKVIVNVSGQVTEEDAGVIEAVWGHFLGDRFTNYINSGKHKR